MAAKKGAKASMIGKHVIVRAEIAGVHAGKVEAMDGPGVILLSGAYRLWRVYTRDKSGSISDIAANGLKTGADHSIGARLKSVLIENPRGVEVAEMTDDAFASVEKYVANGSK